MPRVFHKGLPDCSHMYSATEEYLSYIWRKSCVAGMPGQGGAFVPPEAILAAAHAGGGRQVWQCYICDTMNEMGMEKCKHCNTPKQISDAQEAEMRDAAEKAEQARATVQGGKKKKARAKPMTFQDINRSAAVAHSAWRPK